jgi:hypothetical protein
MRTNPPWSEKSVGDSCELEEEAGAFAGEPSARPATERSWHMPLRQDSHSAKNSCSMPASCRPLSIPPTPENVLPARSPLAGVCRLSLALGTAAARAATASVTAIVIASCVLPVPPHW